MRRFRAEVLPAPGERVRLDAAVSHHLLRVTGVARGEPVELFDGRGGACVARLVSVEDGRAELEGDTPGAGAEPGGAVLLLAAVLRQQPFDLVVRMATELGVTGIWPVLAERCVARGDRADRWQRIAEAAAAQCGRTVVPEVIAPEPLARVLDALPPGIACRICLPGAPEPSPSPPPVAILLGPEGGFTAAEADRARARGFVAAGLGPYTLRGDTAAAVALGKLVRWT